MKSLSKFNKLINSKSYYFLLFKFDDRGGFDDEPHYIWEYGDGVTYTDRCGEITVSQMFPNLHSLSQSRNTRASIHDDLLSLISSDIVNDPWFKEIIVYQYYEKETTCQEILHFKSIDEVQEWYRKNS